VFRKITIAFFNELEDGIVWSDDIERSLLCFGKHMQSVILREDGIAIYRMVLMENNTDQQEIQRIYYKYGPQVAIGMLTEYLDKQLQANKIKVTDTKLAAEQFMEMIKGPFVTRLLFGEEIAEEEVALALKQAVEIFLQGVIRTP
ncbi:MAG: TetR/AcrR family transcriptional regulator C-terminal domain-containing protein, partial [Thiomicrorhabdus sp.]|nr:TetR/AcrR family transcriptional regulator C-terminal domain-containing protein [Thiomicrorhabdus sp.]